MCPNVTSCTRLSRSSVRSITPVVCGCLAGTTGDQINGVVNEVITTVGLEDQRHNAFRQLSGGQQKRLSLGIELITKPNFLFLDEPTSPLDPETTESMMLLFPPPRRRRPHRHHGHAQI